MKTQWTNFQKILTEKAENLKAQSKLEVKFRIWIIKQMNLIKHNQLLIDQQIILMWFQKLKEFNLIKVWKDYKKQLLYLKDY